MAKTFAAGQLDLSEIDLIHYHFLHCTPLRRLIRPAFLLSALFYHVLYASEKDSGKAFFDTLEMTLRADYILCTRDSSEQSVHDLLRWKKGLDQIISSPLYGGLLKEFHKETGIRPDDVRPCEIISWKQAKDAELQEIELLLQEEQERETLKRADSLFAEQELSKAKTTSVDFDGIPFGVSKRGLRILAARAGLMLIDEGNYLRGEELQIGTSTFRGAFYLDKDGRYWKYELESVTGSLDSLDSFIRPQADVLSRYFEERSGSPPDHLYRIGRFDIVQGRLAVHSMWDLGNVAIFTGLATWKYRYYAKAVVSRKASLQEKKSGIKNVEQK